MANVTADIVEQARARYAVRRSGKRCVARRPFCGAHETSEMIDVIKALRVGRIVIGIRNHVAETSDVHVVGRKAIADAHLVQVSITRERKQGGVLIFPSKAAHGERSISFQDRNMHGFSADEAARA